MLQSVARTCVREGFIVLGGCRAPFPPQANGTSPIVFHTGHGKLTNSSNASAINQFGVGLAVAVVLDATVVRCLLVPAVMILTGKANCTCRAGWIGSSPTPTSRGGGVRADDIRPPPAPAP